ncbi:universal stress protein [Natronococcus sp. A-GB1]|uniref:universal stress protein n=1 Tax=Natronococcus sp. A-GB1 TaxID=3037648 RepID=UPI00241DB692|nr:universal stress protein [Natronococcus sp. A-GB1]MDG5758363.1 universal stress protein [Natronococcus sp. A-GB1]
MADPDRVLVPTVGRPREDEALAHALETFPDADVTLLAVVTPLDAPMSEGGVLERDEARADEARDRATRLLAPIADPSATDRVEIETAAGRPGTVIPRYSTNHDIDQVVMRGHDRKSSSLVRRLLGRGVAATVVERTDRPVTVLK